MMSLGFAFRTGDEIEPETMISGLSDYLVIVLSIGLRKKEKSYPEFANL